MQQFIVRLIVPILTSAVLCWLASRIFDTNLKEMMKNKDKEHIIVHLPKQYIWVGCFGTAVPLACIVLGCFFPNDSFDLWVGIGFGFFMLLGLGLIFITLVWKIDVYRNCDYFVYKSVLLKKKCVSYEECEFYINGTNTLKIKTGSKTFRIDNKATNLYFLIEMLNMNHVRKRMEPEKKKHR